MRRIDPFVAEVVWGRLFRAFLRRRIKFRRTGCTLAVGFKTELEAMVFAKLMLSRRGISRGRV